MPDPGAARASDTSAFNAQAAGYDARVGFPPGVGEAVAEAIVRLGEVDADDLVLELGAGTGEIGAHLLDLAPGYLGIDNSPAMLDIFRAKASGVAPRLLVADADADWPLPTSSAQVIFASRVIHLLPPDHVVRETFRVARPGGYLMLGRAQREPGSIKDRLQRKRQDLLRERGIEPRQGDQGSRAVVERCVQAGAESLGRRTVAEWQGETSVAAILTDWESLSRMGSVEVEPATRSAILTELHNWANRETGDVDRRESFREQYVVDMIHMPQSMPKAWR